MGGIEVDDKHRAKSQDVKMNVLIGEIGIAIVKAAR